MSSWLIFASPAPAALLLFIIAFLAYRWFCGSRRLLAKVVAAGEQDRKTLRQLHPEVPHKARDAAADAIEHDRALCERSKALYGAKATSTSWLWCLARISSFVEGWITGEGLCAGSEVRP